MDSRIVLPLLMWWGFRNVVAVGFPSSPYRNRPDGKRRPACQLWDKVSQSTHQSCSSSFSFQFVQEARMLMCSFASDTIS